MSSSPSGRSTDTAHPGRVWVDHSRLAHKVREALDAAR